MESFAGFAKADRPDKAAGFAGLANAEAPKPAKALKPSQFARFGRIARFSDMVTNGMSFVSLIKPTKWTIPEK